MRDSRFFENPKVFNPDNFSAEKKASRNPYAYMGFGQGPRNCIGMRFALLQVKTAIIRLVANYEVLECSKTVQDLVPDPFSRSFMPKGGIWIKVKQRRSD
jgi:cytochrome P450